MPKKIALNINFDSLYWLCGGNVHEFKFPSYFKIADRFFDLAEKYGFKYTIFIIGQDLQNKEVFARVRAWAEAGHEIGNHSWSHSPNLGTLPENEMEREVMMSHEFITRAAGREPRGFIAPSWSASRKLQGLLVKNNYLYDTSAFPSYFIFVMWAKLMAQAAGISGKHNVGAKQFLAQLSFSFGRRTPYIIKNGGKKMVEMPLPATRYLRLPCWHTMNFVFGVRTVWNIAKKILEFDDNFYYLLHPTDLLDCENDLDSDTKRAAGTLERADVPLEKKLYYIETIFEKLKNAGEFITLEQMASNILCSK